VSLLFSQSDDSLFITPGSTFSHTGSFCFWARTTVSSQTGSFVDITDSVFGVTLRFRIAATTVMEINTAAATHAVVTMTQNTWYFFAVTYAGGTFNVYWSQAGGGGTLNTLAFTDVPSGTTYNKLAIGDDVGGAGTAACQGNIQNLKLWNAVVLTAAELQNEMASLRPIRTSGLKMWYPLLTVAGATFDLSGNGNTLSTSPSNPTDGIGAPASWVF
jgi:hypothetical protein